MVPASVVRTSEHTSEVAGQRQLEAPVHLKWRESQCTIQGRQVKVSTVRAKSENASLASRFQSRMLDAKHCDQRSILGKTCSYE